MIWSWKDELFAEYKKNIQDHIQQFILDWSSKSVFQKTNWIGIFWMEGIDCIQVLIVLIQESYIHDQDPQSYGINTL